MKRKQHQRRLKAKQSNPSLEPAAQTFMEHIYELRSRLVWVIGTLLTGSALAYQFRDHLVHIVMSPLHGNKLVYLNPGGGLTFVFTVCLYFGALLTIPVAIYHLYRFLQPVLKERSRKLVVGIVSMSIFLATLGVVFGYLLVIPGAIHFLGEFSGGAVVANLTTDAYLNFVVLHLFGMALLFQLPLLLFIADHIRPLPPGSLFKLQRWVIAGSIIAAAIISPAPDPINLGLVALPIIAVYEIGVVIVWLRRRSYHAANKKPHEVKKASALRPAYISSDSVLPEGIIEALNEASRPTVPVSATVPQPVMASMATAGTLAAAPLQPVRSMQPVRRVKPIQPVHKKVVPVQVMTPKKPPVKTVDGFKVRQAPGRVVVPPSRMASPEHFRPGAPTRRRSSVSIDGIL